MTDTGNGEERVERTPEPDDEPSEPWAHDDERTADEHDDEERHERGQE